MSINFRNIEFLKSASTIEGLPEDSGNEVAFAGRSNAGKSSALNAITGINRLARTSKTPGRTQLINYFILDPRKRLVDLPGYGYAKVTEAIKLHWQKLLQQYFTVRESLKGVILLMDIRHPLKPMDVQMITWAVSVGLPVHILLTKADKLKRGAQHNILLEIKKKLGGHEDLVSVQLFSAVSGLGIENVQLKLSEWLGSE